MTTETLTRPSSPALDAMLGVTHPVLDDGHIRVVDYMGNDSAIVQAARVSYGAGTKHISEDRGLIRYLMRNRHTSPFEMCEIKFHVRIPMDAWRQMVRHRTASINEASTRYSIAIDAAQATAPDAWRMQAKDNKQGSDGGLPSDIGERLTAREAELQRLAREVYQERLAAGVAREQARKDLPLSTYTEAYWKIDLHNLLHFLALRMDSHAQKEIRAYAEVMGEKIVKAWCPLAWEAFVDYRLEALTLSGLEIVALRTGDVSAMSSREVAEFALKARNMGLLMPPSCRAPIPIAAEAIERIDAPVAVPTDASLEARAERAAEVYEETERLVGATGDEMIQWKHVVQDVDASRPGLSEEQAREIETHLRAMMTRNDKYSVPLSPDEEVRRAHQDSADLGSVLRILALRHGEVPPDVRDAPADRVDLTTKEARAAADGTLTEIRRAVDNPPRFWSFMDGLDGVTRQTGYKQIHPSNKGLFIWSVDPRDPQPARHAPLGQPGTVLDVVEEFTVHWMYDAVVADAARAGLANDNIWYRADGEDAPGSSGCPARGCRGRWRAAEDMPSWAVRSRLRITAVRVERAAAGWEWVYSVEKAL